MQKPDPLIRTKLRLPFTRSGLVVRPRLQERIAHGLRGPLTLVAAPAGFGKTTLVASCVAGCGVPLAWLSLDKDDNQVERFLSYLITALQTVDPAIGVDAAQRAASRTVVPEEVLVLLVNDLDASGRETALVLDDYQVVKATAVHEALAFLLEHCPATFHLVIATRSDPPLPLARLRARGQTVELRAADLRFSEQEAAQFLNEVMELQLDTGSVRALAERTEGWIAGLQMAALSMRDREDVAGFIESFSGTHRYILDYLLEEVLAGQPEEVRRFLLRTSILERLSAPLCEALLGEADGEAAATLAYLERANLFLVPLDDERFWYRYHQLFADLLRTQLHNAIGSEEVARLHVRASEWYEHSGFTLDAIHHASLALDFERIERLIEQNYYRMMNDQENVSIRFWMGKLSKELVLQRPWLCLYEAFSRSWFGQLEEAEFLLKEAEKHFQPAMSGPEAQAMLGYHAYVKSRVTAMQGDTCGAIGLCLEARDTIPADRLGLRIEVNITLGYEYFLCGDFENARRTLHEMIAASTATGAVNNPVAGYALLARMEALQGRLSQAYDLVQKAARLIESPGRTHLGMVGLVDAGLAALACERNETREALKRLQPALDLLPLWGKEDDLCLAYVTLARIHLALGNPAEAAEAVAKAAQIVRTSGVFSEARNAVETAQVNLWLAQGDGPAVDRWAAGLENRFISPDPFRYEDEPAHLSLARAWLTRGRLEESFSLLDRLEESARSGGRQGRLIEIWILQAMAYQAAGDTTQAEAALTKSLALAEPQGYVRIFLDEGRPLQRLLAAWLARAGAGPLRQYAARLHAQFEAELYGTLLRAEVLPSGGLVEPLSPREREVLQLIAQGLTNKEIARQLIVSPGTVKAHTASIYRKLDVTNRTEAAARARQLGLLSAGYPAAP